MAKVRHSTNSARTRPFRLHIVSLLAVVMAVGAIVVAAPAGAASSCKEQMDPALQGNSSALLVACTFSSAGVGSSVVVRDYADAVWHWGAARSVAVSAVRTGGNAPGTPTGAIIKTCPTNNNVVAANCVVPGGDPAGNLAISAADVNHSVEFSSSSSTMTGQLITPGSFVVCVAAGCVPALPAGSVKLSKPVLDGAAATPPTTNWPDCNPYANGCSTAPVNVLVSNDTGRRCADGVTNGTATVTSASCNFNAADVGMGISGGDLPDGATIATVNSKTSVTLTCTGCIGGVTPSNASGLVLVLIPTKPPTSSRFVSDGSCAGGNRVLIGGSAMFAPSDIGLPINFVPPSSAPAANNMTGARVGAVAANGSTATIAGALANTCPAGAKKFVIGLATKTAPKTGDAAGTLAMALKVNPAVSPTSPPCASAKVSGFHVPVLWRNPEGTGVAPTFNTLGAAGYNRFVSGNHLSGVSPPGVSVGQFDLRTASTSFSAYLLQDYTTVGGVQGQSTWRIQTTFMPVGIGLCPGTGTGTSWTYFGLTTKIVQNPSFTGGGFYALRALRPEPQGTFHVYGTNGVGADDGASVGPTSGSEQPSNTNSCRVSSPNPTVVGCQ